MKDALQIYETISQLSPAQFIAGVGALITFGVLAIKKGLPALDEWRRRKNRRETLDRQIQTNTDENLLLNQRCTNIEQELANLKATHIHDIQATEDAAAQRKQQSLQIQEALHQEILESREENRNAMNVILEAVNKIREEATNREISNLRYKIIKFSKEIRCNDPKSQDEYTHIFETITEYHKILDALGKENGQINIEVAYINAQYMKHLETNDFVI